MCPTLQEKRDTLQHLCSGNEDTHFIADPRYQQNKSPQHLTDFYKAVSYSYFVTELRPSRTNWKLQGIRYGAVCHQQTYTYSSLRRV